MELKVMEADRLIQIIEPMLKDAKGITAYALAKNLRLLNTELTEYLNAKQELFRKYGEEKDGQITIQKDSENYSLFLEEFKIFENETINIDFRKLKEDDFVSSGLNGEQIFLLSKYFEEGL